MRRARFLVTVLMAWLIAGQAMVALAAGGRAAGSGLAGWCIGASGMPDPAPHGLDRHLLDCCPGAIALPAPEGPSEVLNRPMVIGDILVAAVGAGLATVFRLPAGLSARGPPARV